MTTLDFFANGSIYRFWQVPPVDKIPELYNSNTSVKMGNSAKKSQKINSQPSSPRVVIDLPSAEPNLQRKETNDFEDDINSLYHSLYPSHFGLNLSEVMELQREHFPERKLPWILTALGDKIIELDGQKIEGVFRKPPAYEDVVNQKDFLEQFWSYNLDEIKDVHTATELFKEWIRYGH